MARLITIDQQARIELEAEEALMADWVVEQLVELFGGDQGTSPTGIRAACWYGGAGSGGQVMLDGYAFAMSKPPGPAGRPRLVALARKGHGGVNTFASDSWREIKCKGDLVGCYQYKQSLRDRVLGRQPRGRTRVVAR